MVIMKAGRCPLLSPNVPKLSRPDSFTERTLHAVRELILDGQFSPGHRVNEAELARALGVSRGPLREALQQLSSEGLVLRIQHRGTFIPEFGAAETLELYEVREALEVMATRLAAQRAEPHSLLQLRGILEATRERMETSDEAHYPYSSDLDFHEPLVALAKNIHLEQHAREVRRQLHVAIARSAYKPERALTAYHDHLEILDAIEAGDADRAGEAMSSHLHSGFAHVTQVFSRDPGDRR